MAYNTFYVDIFTALLFPCDPYDGSYRFSGATPSAGIIACVEALPTTSIALVNKDPETDATMLALQAAVSGTQWTAFVAWLTDLWYAECHTVCEGKSGTFKHRAAEYNGKGLGVRKAEDKATLTAAGITRHPF